MILSTAGDPGHSRQSELPEQPPLSARSAGALARREGQGTQLLRTADGERTHNQLTNNGKMLPGGVTVFLSFGRGLGRTICRSQFIHLREGDGTRLAVLSLFVHRHERGIRGPVALGKDKEQ